MFRAMSDQVAVPRAAAQPSLGQGPQMMISADEPTLLRELSSLHALSNLSSGFKGLEEDVAMDEPGIG